MRGVDTGVENVDIHTGAVVRVAVRTVDGIGPLVDAVETHRHEPAVRCIRHDRTRGAGGLLADDFIGIDRTDSVITRDARRGPRIQLTGETREDRGVHDQAVATQPVLDDERFRVGAGVQFHDVTTGCRSGNDHRWVRVR